MITAAIAMIALSAQRMPENPSFDFSGLPQLTTSERVDVLTHSVTLEIEGTREGYVDVTSTTQYKNISPDRLTGSLVIPRRRYGDANSSYPGFQVTATWNHQPISLSHADHGTTENDGRTVKYQNDLSARVTLDPGATYGLRISYQVRIGKGGYEQKQNIVGYLLDEAQPIGAMNIAYRYGRKTVFRLPDAQPNLGWEVGEKGAFVRKEAFSPENQLTFIAFYPGGFDDQFGKSGSGRP